MIIDGQLTGFAFIFELKVAFDAVLLFESSAKLIVVNVAQPFGVVEFYGLILVRPLDEVQPVDFALLFIEYAWIRTG